MNDCCGAPQAWFGGRARLVFLPRHSQARGTLLPLDFDRLPFVPMRVFVVTEVPVGGVRGGHGHRAGQQLLVCIHGRIRVRLSCRDGEVDVALEQGGPALLIGAGIWSEQTYLEEGASMLALASEPFDPGSYFPHREDAT